MELIKIDTDHFVVVNNSEIKEGDWVLTKENTIHQVDYVDAYTKINEWKKITHSTQPLYKNDFWAIQELKLSEVKELLGEVDVEKKVKEYYEKDTTLNNPSSFKAGYNQALKDNKDRKYTEEDMKKMFVIGEGLSSFDDTDDNKFKYALTHIQPKTEWEVEIVDGKLKLK